MRVRIHISLYIVFLRYISISISISISMRVRIHISLYIDFFTSVLSNCFHICLLQKEISLIQSSDHPFRKCQPVDIVFCIFCRKEYAACLAFLDLMRRTKGSQPCLTGSGNDPDVLNNDPGVCLSNKKVTSLPNLSGWMMITIYMLPTASITKCQNILIQNRVPQAQSEV